MFKAFAITLSLCTGMLIPGCKTRGFDRITNSEIESLPSSVPQYSSSSYKIDMPVKFEIAKRIHEKYGVGPRLRFDSYLQGTAEQYYPCWDTGPVALVDPQAGVCYGLATSDTVKYCTASPGPKGQMDDWLCKYPESHSAVKDSIRYVISAAREVSELAAKKGYSFTVEPLELYLIFLGEAGFRPLSLNTSDDIDGYRFLGLDNLSESKTVPLRPKYEDWAPVSLKTWLKTDAEIEKYFNELNEEVYTASNFDLKNGLYALATEYAYNKSLAAKRLFNATGVHLHTLPRRGQLYWTYILFNAGEGVKLKFDVHRYDLQQKKEDNYNKNLMSATFNASVRTSTYAYWLELCQRKLGIAAELCPVQLD